MTKQQQKNTGIMNLPDNNRNSGKLIKSCNGSNWNTIKVYSL